MIGSKPAKPQSGDVLDEDALLARVGGDSQLLRELVDLFLLECPRMMDEIGNALEDQDAGALEKAAHALKGPVGTLGAKGAFEAALKLERIACSGKLAGAESTFQNLSDEIAQLKPALARMGMDVAP